jgi:hypothetical protein
MEATTARSFIPLPRARTLRCAKCRNNCGIANRASSLYVQLNKQQRTKLSQKHSFSVRWTVKQKLWTSYRRVGGLGGGSAVPHIHNLGTRCFPPSNKGLLTVLSFLIVRICSSKFYTESLLIPGTSEGNTNLGTSPYCSFVFFSLVAGTYLSGNRTASISFSEDGKCIFLRKVNLYALQKKKAYLLLMLGNETRFIGGPGHSLILTPNALFRPQSM